MNKVIVPADDTGLFNLLIDGVVKASNVGHNGTTGVVTLNVGLHTVSEMAGTGTARSRCASSSAWTSARPRSSSAARTRVPFFGPSRTSAGLLPMNCGVVARDLPATIVQCSERWWPS